MSRYTPKEASQKLGYSYCYFLSLVRKGLFQYHRISPRKIYFTDEDLQENENGYLVQKKPQDNKNETSI